MFQTRYEYFSQFGEVVIVTVALDNGELVRALADHANSKRQMENEIGGEDCEIVRTWVEVMIESMPSGLRHYFQKYGFGRDIKYWQLQMALLEEEVLYFQTAAFFAMVRVVA